MIFKSTLVAAVAVALTSFVASPVEAWNGLSIATFNCKNGITGRVGFFGNTTNGKDYTVATAELSGISKSGSKCYRIHINDDKVPKNGKCDDICYPINPFKKNSKCDPDSKDCDIFSFDNSSDSIQKSFNDPKSVLPSPAELGGYSVVIHNCDDKPVCCTNINVIKKNNGKCV